MAQILVTVISKHLRPIWANMIVTLIFFCSSSNSVIAAILQNRLSRTK